MLIWEHWPLILLLYHLPLLDPRVTGLGKSKHHKFHALQDTRKSIVSTFGLSFKI